MTEKFPPRSILEQPAPNSTRVSFYDWHVKRRIGSIGLLWDRGGDAWLGVRLPGPERGLAIKRLLDRQLLVGITIAGMPETFYIQHDAVHLLGKDAGPHEASFIAPLDNLLWDRKMVKRLFDFEYRWEVYTPAHSRKYGYYVLPILYGTASSVAASRSWTAGTTFCT